MGCDQPNEDDHPPASVFSLQEPVPVALSISKDGAADYGGISFAPNSFGPDFFPFGHTSLPIAHPPLQKMNMDRSYIQAPETDDKLMAGFLNQNSLQNLHIDLVSGNVRSNNSLQNHHIDRVFSNVMSSNSLQNFHIDPVSGNVRSNNSLQNLHIDQVSGNVRSNVTNHHRASEVTNCEGSPSVEMGQSITASDIFAMNPLSVGSVCSSGLQNPALCMSIMPPGSNTEGGNHMGRQGREAESISVSRLHMGGNSLSLGHSTSAMHLAMDLGQKGSTHDSNFCYDQLGFSEQIDGSLLTLGIGSNREASSNKQFSSREIATKLEEAVHPQSKHVHNQESTRIPPSVTQNRGGNMSSLQSNANQSSSLFFNDGSWFSSSNNDGLIPGASTGLSSRPLYGAWRSQADTQNDFIMNSYGNSDYVGNASVRYSDILPSRGIEGGQDPIPLPYNSNSTDISHSRSTELSGLASASANPAWITPQPMPNHLQNSHAKNNINTLTRSPVYVRHPQLRGSSISQRHIGQLASAHEVDSVQAVNSSAPGTIPGQVTGVGALQTSTDASFSRRLGIQPNDVSSQAISEGNVHHTQNFARSQLSRNLAFALGKIQGGVPVQNSQGLPGVDFTTGQVIHMPKVDAAQATSAPIRHSVKRRAIAPPSVTSFGRRRKITPQPISGHSTSYWRHSVPVPSPIPVPTSPVPVSLAPPAPGPIQVPPVPRPIQVPPVPRPIQVPPGHRPIQVPPGHRPTQIAPGHRPIQVPPGHRPTQIAPGHRPIPVPPGHRPIPVPPGHRPIEVPPVATPLEVPPVPRPIQVPPAPLYIKAQGIEEPPQQLGHKCLICKRDLSYTPEGPFYQPAIPPPVAVLSCGHTFHDHCLQNIIPADQSKDPPCIPCAIGET